MTAGQMMFCLLRNELKGDPLPEEPESFRDPKLYRLSKQHDVCHLVADALIRNNLLLPEDSVTEAYNRALMTAVYREVQIRQTTEKIDSIFQKGQIPFIPLKGTVIRKLYPEPWMRTSCDIDILIREENLSRAVELLKADGFQTNGKMRSHDISLFYNNVHFELHYCLRDDIKQIDSVFQRVWDYATPADGSEYLEKPAFFVFHHLAHMFYHFVHGGCGVRPFLDFWILRRKNFYEESELLPLLEECNLIRFYECICKLTDRWLEGDTEPDEFTDTVGQYILAGGVYGDSESDNAASIARKKGRTRYLFSLVFPPFWHMRLLYPWLKRFPVLLPFCYVDRALKKMFGKDRNQSWGKVNRTIRQKSSNVSSMEAILKELGVE